MKPPSKVARILDSMHYVVKPKSIQKNSWPIRKYAKKYYKLLLGGTYTQKFPKKMFNKISRIDQNIHELNGEIIKIHEL